MCCRKLYFVFFALIFFSGLTVEGKAAGTLRLAVPQELIESGFLKYLLPRFSLKTSTRIELVGVDAEADAQISEQLAGTPVFVGLGKTWILKVDEDNPKAVRFFEWLTGEIGRRTIDGFPEKDGVSFAAAAAIAKPVESDVISGDAAKGERLAVLHCGRCHIVNAATRMSGIGSSPSFAIMRSFADWQARFEGFFSLNPHPSFTIIEDVTEPFDETLPPSIVPVEMTLGELDAIMAFVSRIQPADLGAPLQYQ